MNFQVEQLQLCIKQLSKEGLSVLGRFACIGPIKSMVISDCDFYSERDVYRLCDIAEEVQIKVMLLF